MCTYYVETCASLDMTHVIHAADCPNLPIQEQRYGLGAYTNYAEAVRRAQSYFPWTRLCGCCISADHAVADLSPSTDRSEPEGGCDC